MNRRNLVRNLPVKIRQKIWLPRYVDRIHRLHRLAIRNVHTVVRIAMTNVTNVAKPNGLESGRKVPKNMKNPIAPNGPIVIATKPTKNVRSAIVAVIHRMHVKNEHQNVRLNRSPNPNRNRKRDQDPDRNPSTVQNFNRQNTEHAVLRPKKNGTNYENNVQSTRIVTYFFVLFYFLFVLNSITATRLLFGLIRHWDSTILNMMIINESMQLIGINFIIV